MNDSETISYFFRKSPLIRALCWILLVSGMLVCTFFIGRKVRRTPEIEAVMPPIGSPGDTVVITGKNFGKIRDTSYVEVGGSRLTASAYRSWDDDEIRVVLPPNVQDGLVIVGTSAARSKPAFFANEKEIPSPVPQNQQTSLPVVTSILPDGASHSQLPGAPQTLSVKPGDLIVIAGSNFGNTHDTSEVYFSSAREMTINSPLNQDSSAASVIPANRADFDYAYWSDTEIRVYVPDGAADGIIYVETPKGKSASQKIQVTSPSGTKKYSAHRTYLLQLSSDISEVVAEKNATITLRVPRPSITAFQPSVEMTECTPEPVITDYQHTLIHQLHTGKIVAGKKQFHENFAIPVYEIITEIKSDHIAGYGSMNKMLYSSAVRPDRCVPSADEDVMALAQQIAGKEKNPYNVAFLIYNYMIGHFRLQQTVRTGNISALDLLKKKTGDAYDFAIIYTALLRASGIPALPDSGILVDRDMKVRNHWWCEFYLAGFGWVPVDPALGAGLNYKPWAATDDVRAFYFGNLDSQHILFSRGWNEIKPGTPTSKIVQRPRSYALQSIWEEASSSVIRYSSFWNTPVILGVY